MKPFLFVVVVFLCYHIVDVIILWRKIMKKISLLLLAGFLFTSNAYAEGGGEDKKKGENKETKETSVVKEDEKSTYKSVMVENKDIEKVSLKRLAAENKKEGIETYYKVNADSSDSMNIDINKSFKSKNGSLKVKAYDEELKVEIKNNISSSGRLSSHYFDDKGKRVKSEYEFQEKDFKFDKTDSKSHIKDKTVYKDEDGLSRRIVKNKDGTWKTIIEYKKEFDKGFTSEGVRELKTQNKDKVITERFLKDNNGNYFYKEKLSGGKELSDTKGKYSAELEIDPDAKKEGLIQITNKKGEVLEAIKHCGDRIVSEDGTISDVKCKDYISKEEKTMSGSKVTEYKDGEIDAVKKFDKNGNPRGSYKRALKKDCIAKGYDEKGCNSMSGKERKQCRKAVKKSCKK